MILSHRWRFVFIKGWKIAGSSVEIALSTICGPDDIITPMTPFEDVVRRKLGAREPQNHHGKFYNHMPLIEVAARFGSLNGYRVFCVERSPYSKLISWANASGKYRGYANNGDAMRSSFEEIRLAIDEWRDKSPTTHPRQRARDLLLQRVQRSATPSSPLNASCWTPSSMRPPKNIDLYRDASGAVVATPLRYSCLSSDLASFLQGVGAPMVESLPHVKKGLLSDSIDPREILRRDQLDMINEIFAEEFDTFGYERI